MVYICFQKRTVGSIPAELVSHFSIMTEKLRDIRRLRKVTQTEMAKILGISRIVGLVLRSWVFMLVSWDLSYVWY